MELFKQVIAGSAPKKHKTSGGILSEDAFKAILLHECARCDRNGHHFSLIQMDLEAMGHWSSDRRLIKNIVKRMRLTDEIGWLNSRSIGVFLPETEMQGALMFAGEACGSAGYQVYTYPANNLSSGNGAANRKDNKNIERDPAAVAASDQSIIGDVAEMVHPKGSPVWKRLIDIVGSVFCLILFSPVFLAIAAFLKVVSPGPALFKQERIGYLGRPFTMWKFRTMHVNADSSVHRDYLKSLINGDEVMTKLDNNPGEGTRDNRWVPLAGLLRKSHMDELPQLFNVLKGDMSMVGPRPCLAYEAEEFSTWHNRRFHTFPGMTGLWQVSGKNRLTFKEMMRLDIRYSQSKNFWVDSFIFIKTLPTIAGQVLDSIITRLKPKPVAPKLGRTSRLGRSLSSLARQLFL